MNLELFLEEVWDVSTHFDTARNRDGSRQMPACSPKLRKVWAFVARVIANAIAKLINHEYLHMQLHKKWSVNSAVNQHFNRPNVCGKLIQDDMNMLKVKSPWNFGTLLWKHLQCWPISTCILLKRSRALSLLWFSGSKIGLVIIET